MDITVRWERELHQRGGHSAVVTGPDCVVLHERRTRLVCLEQADGAVRWDVPLGTWPRDLVLARDRVLVLPQTPDRLSCLDLRTGAVLWSTPTPRFTGNLAVAGDTVVIGGWRGYTPMTGLALADGHVRWTTGSPVRSVRPLPWGAGLLTGSGSEVVLLDPRDGAALKRWRLPEPLRPGDGGVFTAPPAGDRFVAVAGWASLVSFGPGARVPEWHAAYEPFAWFGHVGDAVWMHRPAGGFRTVDPVDGSRLWCTGTGVGQQLVAGPVPYGDGFLVGSDNGGVYALGPDGRAVARRSLGRRLDGLHPAADGGLLFASRGTFGAATVTVTP
ncbi:PQQ-binding-like beta-propeller repeat protein [Streptomyces sp. NPDC048551]|uniref:outer membrane protein assembly factor BamB family protein n=1 Tax=Streptomyces sp. NPDC048551 TaxID=3155758 RepID=UPI00344AE26E